MILKKKQKNNKVCSTNISTDANKIQVYTSLKQIKWSFALKTCFTAAEYDSIYGYCNTGTGYR